MCGWKDNKGSISCAVVFDMVDLLLICTEKTVAFMLHSVMFTDKKKKNI